jgi:hypothetical protein
MDPFIQLGLVAEIAATYLGFIAVFIVFSRNDGRFAESDKHFIQGIVISSTSAIVFALLPRVLIQFFDAARVWDISVITALILGTIVTLYQAWSQFVMSAEESKKVHWSWHVPAWAFAALSFVLILAALLGMIPKIGAYTAATTSLLAVAIWCFIAIVFRKFF